MSQFFMVKFEPLLTFSYMLYLYVNQVFKGGLFRSATEQKEQIRYFSQQVLVYAFVSQEKMSNICSDHALMSPRSKLSSLELIYLKGTKY